MLKRSTFLKIINDRQQTFFQNLEKYNLINTEISIRINLILKKG